MPDRNKLGERLRKFRKKAGLTQEELAERVGVHFISVSRWENGVDVPKTLKLKKLASALGVSEAELLNGPEEGALEFRLVLDKEGVMNMNVVNISGNAPEEKVLVASKERLAVSVNLKTAGMDKEAVKKALWEEFCKVFDDGWAQQEKWLATA